MDRPAPPPPASPTPTPSSDVAFTPTVKALQARAGSRSSYARMERGGGWETTVTDVLAGFLARQRSFYLATANADGQPYMQHRGGPAGFLRVLGPTTLGFADYAGNRQFISTGNLADNAKVHLFLMDYAHRRRVKVWGTAVVVDDDPAMLARVTVPGGGTPERAIVIELVAWDVNCPQHIPQLLPAEDVTAALAARDERIAALEAEVARLTPRATR